MPVQVALSQTPDSTAGLRERKKARTRKAIEDAALALFEAQGYDATTVEQIAAIAEVAPTTFFRYFPTKAHVLAGEHDEQLTAIRRAVVERPADDNDLEAVRVAVQQAWVTSVDAARTARMVRVLATSDQLSTVAFRRGQRWLAVLTDALVRRHGGEADGEACSLAARVALSALTSAVERWIARDCTGDLAGAVDDGFGRMAALCAELGRPIDG